MKKAVIGLAVIGTAVALRPVVSRRLVQKMREHCKQMMSQCAGGSEDREAISLRMREHCGQMAAQHEERREPVATA